jgi:two-component system cell cycle sensor histidine kinase/response regulator CckA
MTHAMPREGSWTELAKTDTALGREARPTRSGIGPVLVLALVFLGVAAALALLPSRDAEPLVLAILALLAVIGVFALFSAAFGLLRFARPASADDVTGRVLEALEDPTAVVDERDHVVLANRAYLKLVGADSAAAASPPSKLRPGDPAVAEAVYRLSKAVRERRPAEEEVRVTDPGGTGRWLRLRTFPIGGSGANRWRGGLSGWQVNDITRDRERQESVFQELQHAIDFLDHAPAGFFSADAAGRVNYVNATLASWLDLDLAAATSGALALRDIVAGDGPALLKALQPTPGAVRTEIFDVDLKHRDGTSFPVRILHRVSFSADGTPGASRSLVLNRSHGEDIAEDLRAAEVRFARFFNAAPVAIAAVSTEGAISRTNAAFARQFSSEERGGAGAPTHLRELISADDQPAVAELLDRAARRQHPIPPVDLTFEGPRRRTGRLYASPVSDSGSDQEAIIVYALDTTEQRALEVQFAQSQKMQAIGQLAGGIAHDFNNVLTAIIGFADLLLADRSVTDPAFRNLMEIKTNALRAANLVRQLLAFSRRQTMRPQVLNLSEVLGDVSMLLRRLIGETIELKVEHGSDLWVVRADLAQFEQVVINLAVNARDAMPQGGSLVIRTRNVPADSDENRVSELLPREDFVLIEVQDTGTGMPPEVIEKIFEPFFSTKEVGKGTGLGLATVYGIVKQTGGYIFTDSTVGEGTTFRVYLPRHVPAPSEVAPPKEVKAKPADLSGQGTILLVEDEDAVRAFAQRALGMRGYTVLAAESGRAALDLINEHDGHIDLVVSDVVMPEMDGPTLMKALRKDRPDIKIIFMSGYADEAFKKSLSEDENFSFLQKPFTLKELAAKVKEVFES